MRKFSHLRYAQTIFSPTCVGDYNGTVVKKGGGPLADEYG